MKIRTIPAAHKELQAMDSGTSITKYYIRTLCKTGKIPSVKSGDRYMLDLDCLLRYLAASTETNIKFDLTN